jgi:hypothetical protein
VEQTEIMLANKILRQNVSKKLKKHFFTSLKSIKEGVGSGAGSGFISQKYKTGDPDPH